MQQEQNWGKMLKHFRLKAGYETLGLFADALAEKCALDISTLSRYENNKERIPKDRQRHIELLEALIAGGGIESPQEANTWLASANMGYLTEEEQARLFPYKSSGEAQPSTSHSLSLSMSTTITPTTGNPGRVLQSIISKKKRRILLITLSVILIISLPITGAPESNYPRPITDVISYQGTLVSYNYDNNNRLTWNYDESNSQSALSYQLPITDAAKSNSQSALSYSYDDTGNLVSSYDYFSNQRTWTYNASSYPIALNYQLPIIDMIESNYQPALSYSGKLYDSNGNRVMSYDYRSNQLTWDYNASGHLFASSYQLPITTYAIEPNYPLASGYWSNSRNQRMYMYYAPNYQLMPNYQFTSAQFLTQDHIEKLEPMKAGDYELMVLVPLGAPAKVTLCWKHIYNPYANYYCWIEP